VVVHASNLRRQKQGGLCEFEASLGYRSSTRSARAAQRNPTLKKKIQQQLKVDNVYYGKIKQKRTLLRSFYSYLQVLCCYSLKHKESGLERPLCG